MLFSVEYGQRCCAVGKTVDVAGFNAYCFWGLEGGLGAEMVGDVLGVEVEESGKTGGLNIDWGVGKASVVLDCCRDIGQGINTRFSSFF